MAETATALVATAADDKAKAAATAATTATTTAATSTTAAPATTATETKPAETLIGGRVEEGDNKNITYTLELPKDSLLGPDAIERTTATARTLGLSNEQAQAVLKHEADGVKAYVEREQAAFVAHRDQWFKEVEADKVLGGEHFKDNVRLVKTFSEKWLSKETREFLNESGFGNNPKLFRDLLKLAKASAPDKLVQGQTTTIAKPKTADEMLFPASVGGIKATED
jgi:hypothetical protein